MGPQHKRQVVVGIRHCKILEFHSFRCLGRRVELEIQTTLPSGCTPAIMFFIKDFGLLFWPSGTLTFILLRSNCKNGAALLSFYCLTRDMRPCKLASSMLV